MKPATTRDLLPIQERLAALEQRVITLEGWQAAVVAERGATRPPQTLWMENT